MEKNQFVIFLPLISLGVELIVTLVIAIPYSFLSVKVKDTYVIFEKFFFNDMDLLRFIFQLKRDLRTPSNNPSSCPKFFIYS